MGNVNYEVWHYPAGETGSYNLTDAVDLNNDEGININSSVYSLTLKNTEGKYAGSVLYGDKLEIKLGRDGDLKTEIYGKIEQEEYEMNSSRRVKNIKGYGPSRELQNFLVTQIIKSGLNQSYTATMDGVNYTYDYTKINSATVVKFLVSEFVNTDGKLIDANTYVDTGSLCKPWAQTVGSDFNKVFLSTNPGKVFNEIRGAAFTGAGDYDFYIDNESKLHFEPKGSSTHTDVLREGYNILDYKLKRNISTSYTAIAMFCGKDDLGNSVYATGYNGNGIFQYGFKWGYTNYGWLWENISGTNAGAGLTRQQITDLVKAEGRILCKDIATRQGLPKWSASVTMKGNNEYTLVSGTKVNIWLPSSSVGLTSLILTDIKHNLNNRGWTTTLELEEKDGDIF